MVGRKVQITVRVLSATSKPDIVYLAKGQAKISAEYSPHAYLRDACSLHDATCSK